MWTLFWDMHSGGGQKLKWPKIYIEAPQAEAEIIFYKRFKRNPNRVTCTCCGPDYSISESPTLEDASGFHRGCEYVYFRPDGTECPESEGWVMGKGTPKGYTSMYVERPSTKYSMNTYMTIEEYVASGQAHVIRAKSIKPKERKGTLPEEGYVWKD